MTKNKNIRELPLYFYAKSVIEKNKPQNLKLVDFIIRSTSDGGLGLNISIINKRTKDIVAIALGDCGYLYRNIRIQGKQTKMWLPPT